MFGFTKSLRGRFAAYFAISIFISLLISGLLAGTLVQRYLKQKTISDLKFQVEALSQQIETVGLPQRRYIADLEKMYQTRAIILPYKEQALSKLPRPGARADEVVPDSRSLPVLDWNLLKEGGTQVAETDLPEIEPNVLVVSHGFKAGGELAGAVVFVKPMRLLQSWQPLAMELLIAGFASLAASLLLSILLARRLSRPLHEITQAATAVAEGDFSRELAVRSNDEIGRLADAFRYMSSEVQLAQDQQRQFVINVSHELKTPLTAIAGHAQALQDGVADDPVTVAKSVAVVVSETSRLSRLIEDLISLAKFDARQFELKHATVDVADLIGTVIDSLVRDAGERGVKLAAAASPGLTHVSDAPVDLGESDMTPSAGGLDTMDFPGGAAGSTASGAKSPGITITTDSDRLRQILANLVMNALAHTPEGGEVTVAHKRTASGQIEIAVSDTGMGIDADDLPLVFDRFYRGGKGSRNAGLGLGLSISRELARALGGDISVASTPGQGSCFTVSLPFSG
ncbi:MAG: sensor histidine kinase [Thermoleophilia bacterium]